MFDAREDFKLLVWCSYPELLVIGQATSGLGRTTTLQIIKAISMGKNNSLPEDNFFGHLGLGTFSLQLYKISCRCYAKFGTLCVYGDLK